MRSTVLAAAAVAVLALAGCTAGGGPAVRDQPSSTRAPDGDVAVAASPACDEVRAGIDAFNLGDFDATVEHFEAALPLAEAQDDGSEEAGDLVDAIRYYAELRPDRYPDASRSSPDFARNKAITLGQCRPVDDASESPGTDV